MSAKRVLIVGEQDNSGHTLSEILTDKNFIVIGKILSGDENVEKILELQPDLLLVCLDDPADKIIQFIEKAKLKIPGLNILALTLNANQLQFFKSIRAGVLGYILKNSDPETLCKAAKTVSQGEAFIQPSLLSNLLARFRQMTIEEQPVSPDKLGLTQRELEIISYIARGQSNKDIAEKLFISEKTVKNHVSNILRKMSLEDRTQVAVYAHQNGLFSR